MKAEVVICLLFAIYSFAESFVVSNNSSDALSKLSISQKISQCDKDVDFSKVPCMTYRDHEKIWNGILKYHTALNLNSRLIPASIPYIGMEELRKVLNMPLPLSYCNKTSPNKEEIKSAPTVEAYFVLVARTIDLANFERHYFFEHNFTQAIKFLDKRVPQIRALFKCKFEKLRPINVDRKTIDFMIHELVKTPSKIHNSIGRMMNLENSRCINKQ